MQFSNLDFLVLVSYLLIVLLAGLHASKNDTSKSFFLADKELPWYFIMLSIVATEIFRVLVLKEILVFYK